MHVGEYNNTCQIGNEVDFTFCYEVIAETNVTVCTCLERLVDLG